MKFLEKLAAKFLQKRMTGYVVNTGFIGSEGPDKERFNGWVYGKGWYITWGPYVRLKR